jgi:integrase/recombinase XerD
MIKVPSTPKSKESYAYKMQRFMRFATLYKFVTHEEDFESLLKYDIESTTDILEEFVNYLEGQGLVYEAIKPTLAAPELFLEMNRKLWHKKLVRRGIQKEDRIQGGKKPATNEDIQNMLKYCDRSLRKQSIIHFLASTGIRPAALIDPILKIKHLVSMPNPSDPINHPHYCYAVKVYDESKEGYWAFLTPEARKIIDRYLNGRKLQGENLDAESPLFTTLGSRWNTKNHHLTDDNMKEILVKIIKGAKIERKKTGKRYDKSLTYMFRKRFNTILKLNNSVNSNIAEKLMAHRKGLDGTYLQPTRDECFAEFRKAIPELTIADSERDRLKIVELAAGKSEVEKKNEEYQKALAELKETKNEVKIVHAKLRASNTTTMTDEKMLEMVKKALEQIKQSAS